MLNVSLSNCGKCPNINIFLYDSLSKMTVRCNRSMLFQRLADTGPLHQETIPDFGQRGELARMAEGELTKTVAKGKKI